MLVDTMINSKWTLTKWNDIEKWDIGKKAKELNQNIY